ncbi:uncharacterized protein LOC117528550 [Thalassophryne amazonica]|uniref:uncharacterized protein LOC117528550 n=1 Tax=Thalassophryne amazonica TaxID=390379 RepID=UPI001471DF73|nr:uncharacterized protein LOC117528550 [Thalassophryne amazonica]
MAEKEAAVDHKLYQLNTGDFVFKWSKELTAEFIKLRAESEHLFTGARFSARMGWRTILQKMGLQKKVTPLQAKKKWDNLKKKYKDCKYPEAGEGVAGKPNAATWPWFSLMDEMLGPFTTPPLKIITISDDTPETSTAMGDQEENDEDYSPCCRLERKRKRNQEKVELLELIREDMKLQREIEERMAKESRERMDRLFSLLEKLIEK